MYNAIQKYGWENIEHIILKENLSFEDATDLEKVLIKKYKTNCRRYGNNYGYNMTDGGEGTLGHVAGENVSRINRERLLGKRGKDCCNSRPVICDGVEYESLTEFREKNNFPKGNLNGWLSGKVGMPKKWYDKRLHYKDTDFSIVKLTKETGKRRVGIDGIIFNSQHDLAQYLNVSDSNVHFWFSKKSNPPQEIIDRGLVLVDDPDIVFEPMKHPAKTKIFYDEQWFESQRQLANYIGEKPATLNAWLKGKNSIPEKYKKKGLKTI